MFRLDFVGLIATGEEPSFALPKIYAGHEWTDTDLRRTIGCLQRYHQTIGRGPDAAKAGAADFHAGAGTVIDAFLALLARTEENGLHTVEAERFSADMVDVDWRATLQHTLPAHQGHNVIYVEPRGRRQKQVLSPLGEIQALALLDLKRRIGRLSDLWLRDFDELCDDCRGAIADSDFRNADIATIQSAISSASMDATRDADRELLSLLTSWATDNLTASQSPRLYGTTAFHTVWEDVCNDFLGAGGDNEHAKVASQPQYRLDTKTIPVGPQRPDYLHVDGERIWIADAKWYRFELGDMPQLHDVIKQMVYEMSVAPQYSVEQNCLLLPHVGGPEWKDVGFVGMFYQGCEDERFPKVRVISIDWLKASDAYRGRLKLTRSLQVFGLV